MFQKKNILLFIYLVTSLPENIKQTGMSTSKVKIN